MEIIDISLEIHENMGFYPGDPKFQLKRVQNMSNGDPLNLSELRMGVHTGTHIDAPLHFFENGLSITDLPLTNFYGTCTVIDLSTKIELGESIKRVDIQNEKFHGNTIILFKTKNSTIYRKKQFQTDFIYLSKEAAEFLVSFDVKLIGFDYLSIEEYGSLEPKVHRLLLSKGIIIYEGLNLDQVSPGIYTFIGFPIKLSNSEGAPTRAVLIKN